MDISRSHPIRLVGIRAEQRPDGGIMLIIGTKYAGETTYALPAELVSGLMSDLERMGPDPSSAPANGGRNGGAIPPVSPQPDPSAPPGQIAVRAPKKWMLGNGLPDHPMVVLIVDPQTDQQAAYAFDAKAARDLAVAFVKNADAIAAQVNTKPGSLQE